MHLRASLFSFTLLAAGLQASPMDDLYRITNGTSDSHVEYRRLDLAPGQEVMLADLSGPGKITYFYWTDDSHLHPADGTGTMYEGLVLRIFWDDAPAPSVQVPLWAFFGQFGRHPVPFESALIQVNHLCYMSYLPMPYSRRAVLVLRNDGDERYTRSAAWGVDFERDAEYSRERSRLHVAWSRSNPTHDALHRILDVTGVGQYVGNFLLVNTLYQGWWGEGDTVMEVDGHTYTHSPGTEDEYGSAWEFGEPFSLWFSGYHQLQPGRNVLYRWYRENPVRFQKHLAVDVQNQRFQGGQVKSQDDFTSVAFWYQQDPHPVPALPGYRERIEPSRISSYANQH